MKLKIGLAVVEMEIFLAKKFIFRPIFNLKKFKSGSFFVRFRRNQRKTLSCVVNFPQKLFNWVGRFYFRLQFFFL